MADTPNTPAGSSKSAASPSPRKPAGAKPKAAKPAAKKPAATARSNGTGTRATPRAEARTRFNAAIDEARAGVAALKTEAFAKGSEYRKTATVGTSEWVDDAKAMGEQAKQRAARLAEDGKARASDGLASLGKTVSGTAKTIDEKLGKQYGDYARSAARTMQEASAKLDAKDLGELGDDARKFIKESPGAAIGIAAVAGFFLARMFRGGSSDD
ncbi:MAG: hypothetical protein Q8R44_12060 [Novosphingobium sp.]|nr:hypothetical protein [Novosphingobium sp.]